MNQLPGGQRRDKPPSVRGGELPHRLDGVVSGGVPPRDGAQHRVSGVGADDDGFDPQRLGPPRGGT